VLTQQKIWTEVERAIGVTPIETVSVHPMIQLYDACRQMLRSRARRIPLIDVDEETQQEMVVSVLTQFRILKFVAVNVRETQMLRKPLSDLNVGTYEDISTATMQTPVINVIHQLVGRDISSVPIIDSNGTLILHHFSAANSSLICSFCSIFPGVLLNIYESVDVLTLIKGGSYDDLNLSVGEALLKRPDVSGAPHFSLSIIADAYNLSGPLGFLWDSYMLPSRSLGHNI